MIPSAGSSVPMIGSFGRTEGQEVSATVLQVIRHTPIKRFFFINIPPLEIR
jgi:hypothetical protein